MEIPLDTVKEYDALLMSMLVPDTNTTNRAAAELNKRLDRPESLPILLHFVKEHPSPHVRQLAAVLMRMRLVSTWAKLQAPMKQFIQTTLITLIIEKKVSALVLSAVVEVMGKISQITITANEWPELLPFLSQLTASEDHVHRVIGMKLLATLTDNLGELLREKIPTLPQIFARGLADQVFSVKIASLKAVARLMEWLTTDDEIRQFGQFIPTMLEIIVVCIQQGTGVRDHPGSGESTIEDLFSAFELLNELIECPVPVVIDHIPLIAKTMLEIGAGEKSTSIEMSVRQMALTVVQWLVG